MKIKLKRTNRILDSFILLHTLTIRILDQLPWDYFQALRVLQNDRL